MVMFLGHVKTEQGRKRLENNNEIRKRGVKMITGGVLTCNIFLKKMRRINMIQNNNSNNNNNNNNN